MAEDQQPPRPDSQSITDDQQDRKIEILEDGLKRGERWIIGLTAALTIAAFAALYIARGQWSVMEQQLADSRKASDAQGKVTAKTLANLKGQADSLGKQADNLGNLVAATTSAANSAKTSADAAKDSAAATKQLADATSQAAAASRSLAESASQSSAATQRLAAAANEANTVSRELVKTSQQAINTSQSSQRAFVVAKGVADLEAITYLPEYTNNKPIAYIAAVIWENTGGTPTRDLTISSGCWLDWYGKAPEGDQRAFDVSNIDPADKFLNKNPDRSMLIGPHQSHQAGGCAIVPFPIPELQTLFGDAPYYVFGTAQYKDVFDNGYVHRTDFCFVIWLTGSFSADDPLFAKLKLKPPGINAQPCNKHNCADEECGKEPFRFVTPSEPVKPPTKPPG